MPRRLWSTQAVAGLMLALWLGVFALVASPQLHQWLHPDAQSESHHCLITQIQEQSLLASFAVALVAAPAMVVTASGCCSVFNFRLVSDYRLAPGRAPPSSV